MFSDKKLPDDIEVRTVGSDSMGIVDLVVENEMASSKSEARRLIEQGAVKVNEEKINTPDFNVELAGETLVQVGKRKFMKFKK